jgi:adenine deaminase
MWIMIREASMIRNLVDLLPLVQDYGTDNCLFVTDDREAGTLLTEGHMNSIVRKAVENGLQIGDAVKLATLNVARYHGLRDLGAVAPGYAADLLVLRDTTGFRPAAVFKGGRLVAENGRVLPFESSEIPSYVRDTVRVGVVRDADFGIPDEGFGQVRVVDLIPDQVVTHASVAEPTIRNGEIVADPERDLAKVAVLERHHATGRIGLGLVRGFGLTSGAFASTVAHDAHNIVVVGVDDRDMACCVRRLAEMGGGLVVCNGERVVGELPLEIAGLMSTRPAEEVASCLAALQSTLVQMGVMVGTPFMYLSFLALSVIPELRVTDRGVVDVRSFELVPLGVA